MSLQACRKVRSGLNKYGLLGAAKPFSFAFKVPTVDNVARLYVDLNNQEIGIRDAGAPPPLRVVAVASLFYHFVSQQLLQ